MIRTKAHQILSKMVLKSSRPPTLYLLIIRNWNKKFWRFFSWDNSRRNDRCFWRWSLLSTKIAFVAYLNILHHLPSLWLVYVLSIDALARSIFPLTKKMSKCSGHCSRKMMLLFPMAKLLQWKRLSPIIRGDEYFSALQLTAIHRRKLSHL